MALKGEMGLTTTAAGFLNDDLRELCLAKGLRGAPSGCEGEARRKL